LVCTAWEGVMVKAKTTVVVKRVTCNEALQSSRLRAAFHHARS
jgi:hypothetical protein